MALAPIAARWTSSSGYSWREGHDRENAVKGREPVPCSRRQGTKHVTYSDRTRVLADLGPAPDSGAFAGLTLRTTFERVA